MNMSKDKLSILLAEDDVNLGFVIQDNLKSNNFNVVLCTDGDSALKTFANKKFDLCILDVMMPKKDGFEVAQIIRDVNKEIPIIFLTAKSMQIDKVKGFTIGADDYITKPFDFTELLLRIEAVLKRTSKNQVVENTKEIINIGSYVFDVKNQTLSHKKGDKTLTKKETRILAFLGENINEVVSREIILKSIWGNDDYFSGRSMDVFISKLRKYLGNDKNITIINIHGVGFKLEVTK